ncbi:hypothetical protein HEP73_03812 [Xanthomonas sp. GW]|nr:hypothetical protein HEP73_03812 [Xanthomonas sp. GW]
MTSMRAANATCRAAGLAECWPSPTLLERH